MPCAIAARSDLLPRRRCRRSILRWSLPSPPGRQQSTSPGPSGYGRPRGRRRLGQRLLSFRKTTESFYLCQSWPEMPLRQTSAVCVSWEAYVLSRIDQPGGQIADYRRSGDHEGGGSDSISVVHYVKTSAPHTGKKSSGDFHRHVG